MDKMIRTEVAIGSLILKNPVLLASGTFGYGDEFNKFVDINKFGGIFTKSLTLFPRPGNPPPRISETSAGMLNSIGLENIGVESFIRDKLPILRTFDTRKIINIAGSSIDEYCEVLRRLDGQEGIDAYEINISCPNVKEGGIQFGTDIGLTKKIVRELRKLTIKPLIIKLTPNVTRISEFAQVAENEGADAVSLINTVVGMAVDINTKKPKLHTVTGGLSGPAIKPIALAKVYEVARSVRIPVIGVGGIMNWKDAVEFLITGATAIQVGTANFIDPNNGIKIIDGIISYCQRENIDDIRSLINTLII